VNKYTVPAVVGILKQEGVSRKVVLAERARLDDSPDSFAAFYELLAGNKLPAHARLWIEQIYEDHSNNLGTLIWAFRGSWKTTTITVFFSAYRLGKEPYRVNLISQATDMKANDSSSNIANIIEHHPAWKMVFPNIVPDKDRGWGQMGYEVVDKSVSVEDWTAINATRKDPSMLGSGITSSSLIGGHPDGLFIFDDIHDDRNTVSIVERTKIVRLISDTLLPMAVEDLESGLITWIIAVGTPWNEDDAYHYLKDTGEFGFIETPAMVSCAEGTGNYIDRPEDLRGSWKLTWPERFGIRSVNSWRKKSGQRGFARMYLLDLSKSGETGIKYYSYPSDMIDLRLPTVGGVDYASTMEIRNRDIDPKDRSQFALIYVMKLPLGGAVIYDGVVGHYSQLQSENYVTRAQGMFPGWLNCGVEMNGKGEEFFAILSRHPGIIMFPHWVSGEKTKRQETQVAPYLEAGIIKVSDADTPFLTAFRKSLEYWPNDNLDMLDALYSALKVPEMADVLVMPDTSMGLPQFGSPKFPKVRKPNPFAAFGNRKIGMTQ